MLLLGSWSWNDGATIGSYLPLLENRQSVVGAGFVARVPASLRASPSGDVGRC